MYASNFAALPVARAHVKRHLGAVEEAAAQFLPVGQLLPQVTAHLGQTIVRKWRTSLPDCMFWRRPVPNRRRGTAATSRPASTLIRAAVAAAVGGAGSARAGAP